VVATDAPKCTCGGLLRQVHQWMETCTVTVWVCEWCGRRYSWSAVAERQTSVKLPAYPVTVRLTRKARRRLQSLQRSGDLILVREGDALFVVPIHVL
jgi:hypothetical protein